jgi:biopolymer transport protein ExbD
MPKIKIKRTNITTDMTAMCDVAFLLLTFFILTTKFKPNEPVQVDIPASKASIELPKKDIMLLTVDTAGRIFFGVDDQVTREALLSKLAINHNLKITTEMMKKFKNMEQFGVPIEQLPALLELSPEDVSKYRQPGIQVGDVHAKPGRDSVANQLGELVIAGRTINNKIRIAVKGDKDAHFREVEKIIETLRATKTNIFNLITSEKSKAQ